VRLSRQALVAGYVVKGSLARDLVTAIDKVSLHQYFFDSSILDKTPVTNADLQEILRRSAAFEKALLDSEQWLGHVRDHNYSDADRNAVHQQRITRKQNLVSTAWRTGRFIEDRPGKLGPPAIVCRLKASSSASTRESRRRRDAPESIACCAPTNEESARSAASEEGRTEVASWSSRGEMLLRAASSALL
jgi:hypothetical protein